MTKRKSVMPFFIILVLLATLLGALQLTKNNQNTQREAYFAGAKLIMLPETVTSTVNNDVPVQLWVQSDMISNGSEAAKISSVDASFCYGDGLSLGTNDPLSVIDLNQDAFKDLVYVKDANKCLRIVAVSSGIPSENLKSGLVRVASVRFKAVAVGSGTLALDKSKSIVAGYNPAPGATDTSMKIGGVNNATYIISGTGLTITPTKVPTGTTGQLVISNIQATNITTTTAVISWNLSGKGTGQVEYGTTTGYGSFSTPETSLNWDYHSQTISNLNPGTQYHFRVISGNGNVIVKSGDNNFATLGSPVTPTRVPTVTPTRVPTVIPTEVPTVTPTRVPTVIPTEVPTVTPTEVPGLCKECPTNFACYQNDGNEYHWFVSDYIMDGFYVSNDPTCGGVVMPQFLGKSKGDANCDGSIDVFDFSLWQKEFIDGNKGVDVKVNYWNADFTGTNGVCDGRVDIYDFSLWQKFFSELK